MVGPRPEAGPSTLGTGWVLGSGHEGGAPNVRQRRAGLSLGRGPKTAQGPGCRARTENCTDWGTKPRTSLPGRKPVAPSHPGAAGGGSTKLHGGNSGNPDLEQTDQRRALGGGLALSVLHRSPRVVGARWISRRRGRDHRPVVPSLFPSDRCRGSDHLVAQTNPPVRGRVSADRSEEAAQPLTTPRLVRKSSTDDSVRLHCMWGLGAFGRVTSTFPDATEVPLHGLRKDGSRHVP